jgi:dihydrofolate synthase/folylpolyglutamate synthase
VFDIAHNTASATALASVLGRLELPRPIVVLTAVLGDKDWHEMLPPLFEKADHAVLTQAPSAPLARRWDPHEAAAEAGAGIAEIRTDFDDALDRARELAGSGTIVVSGSAHTVGDALRGRGLELS